MTGTSHAATTTRAEMQPRLKLPKSVRKFIEVRFAVPDISSQVKNSRIRIFTVNSGSNSSMVNTAGRVWDVSLMNLSRTKHSCVLKIIMFCRAQSDLLVGILLLFKL